EGREFVRPYARGGGDLQGLLPYPEVRGRGDLGGEIGAFADGQVPTVDRFTRRRGGDDEALEVRDDVGPHRSLAAPIRHGGGKEQILAEQVPAHAGEVGQQRGVLQDPGTDGVDHGDRSGVRGLDEPGHPAGGRGGEIDRIALDRGQ